MNFKNIALVLATVLVPFIASAQEPAKSAHAKAHKNLLIAKNTPAINLNSDVPGIEMPGETPETNNGLTSVSKETNRLLDDILTEARKHMGKKYVWGSKGPNTFDCSGFSSYVYKQFGYKISPGSRIQATQGVPVAKGDLRKGDLVFFTSRSSGGNVGHVGIVVSADNANNTFSFIHASLSGVKISEYAGYYKQRYLFARRVITD